MKRFHLTVDGKTYAVEVLDDPAQAEVRVDVDGEVFTVAVEARHEEGAPAAAAPVVRQAPPRPAAAAVPEAPQVGGSNVVKSPLPGVVKSIAVSPGQTVAFNDELCVIEAMKAMNVIRAPRAGTIGTIYVTEGRKVPYGSPLMDLG